MTNSQATKLFRTLLLASFLGIVSAHASVESAVKNVESDPTNDLLRKQEIAKLQASIPLSDLLSELLEFADEPTKYATRAAANDLIWAMSPFPFQELASMLPRAKDSYRKGTLLWLLQRGAAGQAQIDQVTALAKNELANQEPGVRRYERQLTENNPFPELRLCDLAYSIVRHNLKLIHLDPNIKDGAPAWRNPLLEKLHADLGMPPPDWSGPFWTWKTILAGGAALVALVLFGMAVRNPLKK